MSPPIFFGLVITVGLGNGILLPNANAGMLSVRPQLAGSAAGLGGAFIIGGGAALSALAGALLQPGSGTLPLILLMLASSALSILCILWVMRRARQIGALTLARAGLQRPGSALQTGRRQWPHRSSTPAPSCARLRGRAGPDAEGLCRQAWRLAALPEPDGEQPPPGLGGRGAGAGAGVRLRRDRTDRRRKRPAGQRHARGAGRPGLWHRHAAAGRPAAGRLERARRWRAPSWTCTAPTGRPTNASPRWTRRWGATMPRCAPRPGRRCATSFTIATITSMRSTARPNISRPQTGARRDPLAIATEALAARGITPALRRHADAARLRSRQTRRLAISARAAGPTQRFQLLHQVALLTQNDLLEATLDLARFQTPEARDIAKIGLANYFAGAALLPYRAFLQRRARHAARSGTAGRPVRRLDRTGRRTGCPRCSGPAPRAFRSSSSGSIRRARSPSAIRPPGCNSPASAGPARCGTCTRRLKRRAGSCANWPRRRTGCAICALRAMCRNPAARSTRRCAAMPSALAARCSMPARWSMPTGWI